MQRFGAGPLKSSAI